MANTPKQRLIDKGIKIAKDMKAHFLAQSIHAPTFELRSLYRAKTNEANELKLILQQLQNI